MHVSGFMLRGVVATWPDFTLGLGGVLKFRGAGLTKCVTSKGMWRTVDGLPGNCFQIILRACEMLFVRLIAEGLRSFLINANVPVSWLVFDRRLEIVSHKRAELHTRCWESMRKSMVQYYTGLAHQAWDRFSQQMRKSIIECLIVLLYRVWTGMFVLHFL